MNQVHKLKSLGIERKLGSWIHNFLKGRKQAMNITEAILLHVLGSGLKGTVLRPILFLIPLSDIDGNISSNVSSFADDTKISDEITSEEDVA